jgi:predicted nucleic acid-binding protein
MKKILVDSNVFLDIAGEDTKWYEWSASALQSCADSGWVVINPIIYAEISVRYETLEELEKVLSPLDIERADIPWAAAFLAGKCFMTYRKRGGAKRSPLPDFFIGAHAAVEKMALLTRDPQRYRDYFPTVELICPD